MPNLPIEKDIVFSPRGTNGLKLRYLQFRAATNADTVTTQTPNNGTTPSRDVGFFAYGNRPSGSGVAESAFYVAANVVKDFILGDEIQIKNSAGQRAAIVYLS